VGDSKYRDVVPTTDQTRGFARLASIQRPEETRVLYALVSETRTYDARLRPASISDGSLYTLTIPATGGLCTEQRDPRANDSVNGNWVYTYDDFNHLKTAWPPTKA